MTTPAPAPAPDDFEFGDEDTVTDITIGTDGRVYVFGASRPVLDLLQELGMSGLALAERLAQSGEQQAAAVSNPATGEGQRAEKDDTNPTDPVSVVICLMATCLRWSL